MRTKDNTAAEARTTVKKHPRIVLPLASEPELPTNGDQLCSRHYINLKSYNYNEPYYELISFRRSPSSEYLDLGFNSPSGFSVTHHLLSSLAIVLTNSACSVFGALGCLVTSIAYVNKD
ncbi:hypothetical protein E2C01_024284 [Portunus trituberculatus]|uniref:Uncharacterized protein n=1 Tax=Portunus trituberculatus TaxID=210409 RepID=A0A5B7E9X4_PORTR|nr:hypothetical protein [Portunus trituberculatus]